MVRHTLLSILVFPVHYHFYLIPRSRQLRTLNPGISHHIISYHNLFTEHNIHLTLRHSIVYITSLISFMKLVKLPYHFFDFDTTIRYIRYRRND